MAVKMRLMRMGKKRSPHYRVVVIDGRAPRDGRYIDQIGLYDPHQDPSLVEIDNDKAVDWLKKGVQPTDTVRKLLEISGAMSRFKVASGKIHTVSAKPKAEPAPAAAVEPEPVAAPAPEPERAEAAPAAAVEPEPVTAPAPEPELTEAATDAATAETEEE